MLAMQYSIQLPNGYDTRLIRSRVSERKALFDGLPGLVHKSYLLSEADHVYAPFYIWSDVAQARAFLFNDLFRGVIIAFRRPRVRTWMVLDSMYANRDITPSFGVREADIVAPEDNLEALFTQEKKRQSALADNENLHFYAVALDAERWEIVRYSLWRNEKSAAPSHADCINTYEVLHFHGSEGV
jgi:hypothetical protein